MQTTLFSNANSAIPRSIWERYPFAEDIVMSEDQEWSVRVLLDGFHIRYEPRAVVRHSHDYPLKLVFRRFFDSGASSGRSYLAGGESARRILLRNAVDYGRGEIGWLVRTGNARRIPDTVLYEVTKFTALQVGAQHARLPLAVKRRLSAFPDRW
jgi:rhamnosyltransferase